MKHRKAAPKAPVAGEARRNAAVVPADARPSSDFELSAEEMAMLSNWVTEDEADIIITIRREKEGQPKVSYDQVLKNLGLRRGVDGKVRKAR